MTKDEAKSRLSGLTSAVSMLPGNWEVESVFVNSQIHECPSIHVNPPLLGPGRRLLAFVNFVNQNELDFDVDTHPNHTYYRAFSPADGCLITMYLSTFNKHD